MLKNVFLFFLFLPFFTFFIYFYFFKRLLIILLITLESTLEATETDSGNTLFSWSRNTWFYDPRWK